VLVEKAKALLSQTAEVSAEIPSGGEGVVGAASEREVVQAVLATPCSASLDRSID
jgi:hypothetical protein